MSVIFFGIDIDTIAFVLRDGVGDRVEKLGRMNGKTLRRVVEDGADCRRQCTWRDIGDYG
jgi:hypothetical protein